VRTVDCFAQSISAKTKGGVSRVLTVAKIGKTTNRSLGGYEGAVWLQFFSVIIISIKAGRLHYNTHDEETTSTEGESCGEPHLQGVRFGV